MRETVNKYGISFESDKNLLNLGGDDGIFCKYIKNIEIYPVKSLNVIYGM